MVVKDIKDEVFQDYYKPSMLIATSICDWKCCVEQGLDISICQNSELAQQPNIEIPTDEIFSRYVSNFVTSAIVIGGLEPILQIGEIYELIKYFRDKGIDDDFVIYTGYYKEEIYGFLLRLMKFKNIIIKYGRFIPNYKPHYDEILGINLASDNQYAERIS